MKQEIVKNENIQRQQQQIGMQPFSIEMDKNIQMNPLYVPSSKSNNNKNSKVKGKKNDTQKRTIVETILHHVIIVAILFLFYGIPTLLLYTTISLDKCVLPKELLNRLEFLDINGTNITLDKDYDPEETKSLNCFIYSTTGNYTEQFRNTFSHKCRNMENKELTTWYVEFHKHFNNGGDPHLYLDYRWMDNPSLMSCREKFVV